MRKKTHQQWCLTQETWERKEVIQTLNSNWLTFDFLADSHIKLVILQLLPSWDIQRKTATIQRLSTADGSRPAVFPYGHIPCSLKGMKGVAVFVWTDLRWINLSQTRVGKVYFERFRRRSLQVPGERAVKSQQMKQAVVGLDDVAVAGLCGTFCEETLTNDFYNKQTWLHCFSPAR